MKFSFKDTVIDVGTVAVGSFLFAAAVNMFILPGKIILGGATGISTVLNLLLGAPVGIVILALNIPLVLINAKLYGIKFFRKTIIGILSTSVATDLCTFLPITLTDPMLCALFGGISMGIGAGLLFTRGFTTGGTDLIAWIVKYRYKRFSTGKIIMAADFTIIAVIIIILGNYVSIIYSLIASYSFSAMVDLLISGSARAKTVFIISEKYREIGDKITDEMKRGVTSLEGKGWYTNSEKKIIICVVKPNEIFHIKSIISSIDKNAFVFFNDTTEVVGYGFEQKE